MAAEEKTIKMYKGKHISGRRKVILHLELVA